MCLILIAYRTQTAYPVILVANRDEFFSRPTASCRYWDDAPQVLAGRDLQAGGTWLGVNRQGKLAALTNYRQGVQHNTQAHSRGQLPSNFLSNTHITSAIVRGVSLSFSLSLFRSVNP